MFLTTRCHSCDSREKFEIKKPSRQTGYTSANSIGQEISAVMQQTARRLSFLSVVSAGCLTLPVSAQTVTPASGVWTTTT
jgi:hypothetical protein